MLLLSSLLLLISVVTVAVYVTAVCVTGKHAELEQKKIFAQAQPA
jgi:hypothetical protein